MWWYKMRALQRYWHKISICFILHWILSWISESIQSLIWSVFSFLVSCIEVLNSDSELRAHYFSQPGDHEHGREFTNTNDLQLIQFTYWVKVPFQLINKDTSFLYLQYTRYIIKYLDRKAVVTSYLQLKFTSLLVILYARPVSCFRLLNPIPILITYLLLNIKKIEV